MSSNRDGFGEDGIHRVTGTAFGPDGYDMVGCDKNGQCTFKRLRKATRLDS